MISDIEYVFFGLENRDKSGLKLYCRSNHFPDISDKELLVNLQLRSAIDFKVNGTILSVIKLKDLESNDYYVFFTKYIYSGLDRNNRHTYYAASVFYRFDGSYLVTKEILLELDKVLPIGEAAQKGNGLSLNVSELKFSSYKGHLSLENDKRKFFYFKEPTTKAEVEFIEFALSNTTKNYSYCYFSNDKTIIKGVSDNILADIESFKEPIIKKVVSIAPNPILPPASVTTSEESYSDESSPKNSLVVPILISLFVIITGIMHNNEIKKNRAIENNLSTSELATSSKVNTPLIVDLVEKEVEKEDYLLKEVDRQLLSEIDSYYAKGRYDEKKNKGYISALEILKDKYLVSDDNASIQKKINELYTWKNGVRAGTIHRGYDKDSIYIYFNIILNKTLSSDEIYAVTSDTQIYGKDTEITIKSKGVGKLYCGNATVIEGEQMRITEIYRHRLVIDVKEKVQRLNNDDFTIINSVVYDNSLIQIKLPIDKVTYFKNRK